MTTSNFMSMPLNNSPAYPSGHTTDTCVLAEILVLLLPEKMSALRARADEIAWHRVEAGVHYPVDLEGGAHAFDADRRRFVGE